MRSHREGGVQTQRQLRVGELLRHALAEVLARGELRDPELEGVTVTVPEVTLTPDLKTATAYIMPLGGRDAEGIARALERNRRFLRGAIARRVSLRYSPEIHFRVDRSFSEGEKIDSLLRSPRVLRDLDPTR